MSEDSLLSEVEAPVETVEASADSAVVEQAVESTEPVETTEVDTPADSDGWYFSDGVKGDGETPEWFKSGKYNTVEDQAKAYLGLESKLGAFTGAPKDGYEVVLPDDMVMEIPDDDPLLNNFNDWANEAGLSQEAHSKLLGVYASSVMMQQPNIELEMKKLGNDAQQRITDMVDWGKGNLDEGEFATLQSMANTADGFKLLERMKSMTRETQVSAPDTAQPVNTVTQEALYELIGDERYSSSPSFRAEVDQKFKDFYGTEPAKTIRQ